ncbi:MAG: DUF4173 domain-containing protein [Pyrinomonadaceae bacterium]
MSDKTRSGLAALEAAMLLGVLGDALLRATPWGINLLLWTCALALATFALLWRWRREALKSEGQWLLLPVIFFAAAFVWRDSAPLQALDILALLVALSLYALSVSGGRIVRAGLFDYALGIIVAGLSAMLGSIPLLISDVKWAEIPRTGWSRHLFAVARGLVIAVPLLFIFGLLFMAADAVFEGIVNRTFNLNADQLLSHVVLTVFIAWVAGGFLREALMGGNIFFRKGALFEVTTLDLAGTKMGLSEEKSGEVKNEVDKNVANGGAKASRLLSLGVVEISVVLGLLDLLFLAFVVIQVRYFFGGAALVRASSAMTYAEYARRGFFELTWAAALVLPILLVAHWLLRKEKPLHERIFRVLAGTQVLLLFVIMASALGRMRLYQNEYGLTELRLYTTAFMIWLLLVFLWFCATVLRGARERFACGALVAAFLITGALHFINPDALIVRTNMAHSQASRSFDAGYALSLSADAAPALLQTMNALSEQDRCAVASRLLQNWSTPARPDWRTWNLSRSRARESVQANAETLRALSCQQNEPERRDIIDEVPPPPTQ